MQNSKFKIYTLNFTGEIYLSRIIRSKFFSNLIFKNAYINIAPSHYLFEAFKKGGYTNLRYIPNTIEIQNYPSSPKEFKTPKILWVRSFAKIYNPLMAIKVFMKIKNIFPESKICMVGPKKDDSHTKALKFAKKNNVEKLFLRENYQKRNGLNYQKNTMFL